MKRNIGVLLRFIAITASMTQSLWVVPVSDLEENLRYASPEDIKKLGLLWNPDDGSFIGWDNCKVKAEQCKCAKDGKQGVCDYGKDKKGLYCHCSAAEGPRKSGRGQQQKTR